MDNTVSPRLFAILISLLHIFAGFFVEHNYSELAEVPMYSLAAAGSLSNIAELNAVDFSVFSIKTIKSLKYT